MSISTVAITIDNEFKSLIHPLSQEEYKELEELIIADGCRDPLVIWQGQNILIDGHHRYKICDKHDIKYQIVEQKFDTRAEAKAWIIRNQLGRRNVNRYKRAVLALQLKGEYEAIAKERQGTRTDLKSADDNIVSDLTQGRTRDKLAKIAGVSTGTLSYVQKLEEFAPEALKTILAESDKVAISDAWRAVQYMNNMRDEDFDADGNPIDEYREHYGGKTFDEVWEEVLSRHLSDNAFNLYDAACNVSGYDDYLDDPPKKVLDADAYNRDVDASNRDSYGKLAKEATTLGVEFEHLPEDASPDEYERAIRPLGGWLIEKVKEARRKQRRKEQAKAKRSAQAAQDKGDTSQKQEASDEQHSDTDAQEEVDEEQQEEGATSSTEAFVDWQPAIARIDSAYQQLTPIMEMPVEKLIADVQDSSQFQQAIQQLYGNLTVCLSWCNKVLEEMGMTKVAGVRGRPPKLDEEQRALAVKLYKDREHSGHSVEEICQMLDISAPTLYDYVEKANLREKELSVS